MALGRISDEESEGGGGLFAEINITPLTDIFLVLLIIFMVSSSVIVDAAKSEGVKVNLPKGAAKDIDPGAKSLVVSITKAGAIMVSGQPVQESDLRSVFKSAVAKDPATTVIIEADEGVTHGIVVHVMETAKDSGIVKLAIATRGGGGGK